MSNIKRSNNPFNGPLAKNQVGGNYGDRSRLTKTLGTTSRPAPTQARDQFSRSQKAKNVDMFSPDAKYDAGRKRHAGAPHKPGKLDHMEKGMIPHAAESAPKPSDPALLKFLGLVIEKKELHSRRTLQNSVRANRSLGNPAQSIPARKASVAATRPLNRRAGEEVKR